MKDYIWPRCPSNWNKDERDFFRALLQVLQRMARPIEESDLSKKLLEKILNPPTDPEEPDTPVEPDEPTDPDLPNSPVLFEEGFVPGYTWTGNVLARPEYTEAGSYNVSSANGYMGVGVNQTEDESPLSYNAHLITEQVFAVPEGATTMKVSALQSGMVSEDSERLIMQFGILPSDAPGAYDVSNGGQLSEENVLDGNESQEYSMTLNTTEGNYKAIINVKGIAGARADGTFIGKREAIIFKVWFE